MPRIAKKVEKRERDVDAVYNSTLVTRFINLVMERGKKSVAKKIVYGALENLSKDKNEAVKMLEQAVSNVAPRQEVRSRRVGGATYQVPVPVNRDRSITLAVRWVLQAAKSKKGVPMVVSLTREIKSAYNNEGEAVSKRETMHRMAQANKAFAHFRW